MKHKQVKSESAGTITPPTNNQEADYQKEENSELNGELLRLPQELQLAILTRLSLTELLVMREASKGLRDMADLTINEITQPKYIIRYLSQADGKDGHQFTAAYQCTSQFKALKKKVLTQQPLTDEETICYALTRDSNQLPPNLNQAMAATKLDETTTKHLKLIIAASKEIQAMNDRWQSDLDLRYNKLSVQRLFQQNIDNLNGMLAAHHPQQFVNLLAGANLSLLNLSNVNFTYLNLRNVKLWEANLSGANLTGVSLIDANLSNADLSNANLTDTNLAGANLSRTNLAGVELYKARFNGTNFEWALLAGARLLPEAALTDLAAFRVYLEKFQQRLKHQTLLSQRALQEQLLKYIAEQLAQSTTITPIEKMAFLNEAIAIIVPKDEAICLLPFQNACMELKEELEPKKVKNTSNHPARKEAQAIIESIMQKIQALKVKPATPKRRHHTPPKMEIYQEYKQLMDLLKKNPDLSTREKICKALDISPELWHSLYFMNASRLLVPDEIGMSLVDYPVIELGDDGSKRYASEVFVNGIFCVEKLQRIALKDLENYLYEEDFVIMGKNGREEVRVKLGDLFITFCPGGKGSVVATIETIDFDHHERKPAFTFDVGRYSNIPFEAFVPLYPFVNYGAVTAVGHGPVTVDFLKQLDEAAVMKKQLTERVFVSERANRARKDNLIGSLAQDHMNPESHLAKLPTELLLMVGDYVYEGMFNPNHKPDKLSSLLAFQKGLEKKVEEKLRATVTPAVKSVSGEKEVRPTSAKPSPRALFSAPATSKPTSTTPPSRSASAVHNPHASHVHEPTSQLRNKPATVILPAPPSKNSSVGRNPHTLHAPETTSQPRNRRRTTVTPPALPSRNASVGRNPHAIHVHATPATVPGQQPTARRGTLPPPVSPPFEADADYSSTSSCLIS